MKLILVLFAILAIVYTDSINSLSVISPLDLMRKQVKPTIKMTDFSFRKGNLDIYRYMILAEPFDACSSLKADKTLSLTDDFLVLADGKGCSYRKKAHMAKLIGAIGIVILNDDESMATQPYFGVKDSNMLSFLIDESEGLIIKNHMTNGPLNDIYVRLNYETSSRTQNANLQIWVSAIDHNSYVALHLLNDTLRDFPQINEMVDWKPRYVFYGCNKNSSSSGQHNICNDTVATKLSCACGGQFCSPAEISTTSNTIVLEDIRQKEIFKAYPELYFSYVKGIEKKCLQKYIQDKNIDSCSSKIAENLGMNLTLINERVEEAARYCNNSIYKDLLFDKVMYSKIGYYPAITLNSQIIEYSSTVDFQKILCKRLGIENSESCKKILVTIDDNGMPWYIWLFLFVGIAAAGIFVLLWHRKRMNKNLEKEMKMQVDTAISHYYTFNQTELK